MENTKNLIDQSFRDSVATISKEGKRNYITPQQPKGKLYNLRTYFSYFYLILFFTLPRSEEHTSDSSHEWISRMPSSA